MSRTPRASIAPSRPTANHRAPWPARSESRFTGLALVLLLLASPAGARAPAPFEGRSPAASGDETPTADDGTPERQVILITGSTGGLGREAALGLAETGAHVIVHGRDLQAGAEVVAEIESRGTGGARFYPADLSSLDQVRGLAEAILADYDRLDVLVNNAGIWQRQRAVSAEGYEQHFAVNYLAGFLLTRLLLTRIVDSAPARIVNVASAAQAPLDFDDPMLDEGWTDGRAYAQSKLAQILFTVDLAEELVGTEVTVVALHPATLMDTGMVLSRGIQPRASVEEGTEALLRLIAAPGIESGQYYDGTEPTRAHAQAYDPEARRRLREMSYELTGLSDDAGSSPASRSTPSPEETPR